jgi:hypothetical protein
MTRYLTMIGTVLLLLAAAAPAAQAQRSVSAKDVPDMQHVFESLPRDLQEELMAEAERAQQSCESHSLMAVYQDCECIKYKFLNKRLAEGM